MIVVDSSVWIGHFRDLPTQSVRKLRTLADPGAVIVGDLILMEVLQGARDEAHAARIEGALRQFTVRPMLGDKLASQAARYYRALRGKGITIRKAADVAIATFCIAEGYALLHDDRDFAPFARHLGLRTI